MVIYYPASPGDAAGGKPGQVEGSYYDVCDYHYYHHYHY